MKFKTHFVIVRLSVGAVLASRADVVGTNEDSQHLPVILHINGGIISGLELLNDITIVLIN